MLRKAIAGPGAFGGLPRQAPTRLIPLTLLIVSAVAFGEGLRLVLSSSSIRPSAPPGWYLCAVAIVLAAATTAETMRPVAGPDADSTHDTSQATNEDKAVQEDNPGQERAVWQLLAMMMIYAFALPWIGFALTNGLFTVGYLRWIAGYSRARSLAYGVLIDATIVAFFTQVGVLLPPGVFGL